MPCSNEASIQIHLIGSRKKMVEKNGSPHTCMPTLIHTIEEWPHCVFLLQSPDKHNLFSQLNSGSLLRCKL